MNIQLNGGPYDGRTVDDVDSNAVTLHARFADGDIVTVSPGGDLDVLAGVPSEVEHIYVRLDSLPIGVPPVVNFGYEGCVQAGEREESER